jgi:hypothetical protein
LGLKGSILFLEILNLYFLADEYEAAMGGGARSAPFGVAMRPKRRVRAAHVRARAAKTH